MSIAILTPLGALLAVVGLVPILALRTGDRRARALGRRLGLADARPSRAAFIGVATVAALLGLAASQPVLAVERGERVRMDAEVYVVLDTSQSMLASRAPDAPTRFDRAKAIAIGLRGKLEGLPVGIASLTDRVLPHLLPSGDHRVYTATMLRAMDVENPPPDRDWVGRATTYSALSALATGNFYSDAATSRAFVLLSDGETRPYSVGALSNDLAVRGIKPVVVHVSDAGERIYVGEQLDPGYAPDPASSTALAELAAGTGGVLIRGDDVDALARAVRVALGDGEHATVGRERTLMPLAPWLFLVTVFPLGFMVARQVL